jgi:hypothetical protein
MSTSVYTLNKGINKPVEFKGFKAQYIWYLGGGLVVLLILFAVLYICGINPFLCLGLIGLLGSSLCLYISRLSNRYGAHGLMKKIARRRISKVLKCYSRRVFIR